MLRLLSDDELTLIYNQYMIYDFPDNELKPLDMLIKNPDEYCYGYEDKGYCHLMIKNKVCILDYLAVFPSYRNKGYGAIILKEIRELLKDHVIIIESETPYDDLSKRRISFYTRNGFILNSIDVYLYYVHYNILSNVPVDADKILEIYKTFYPDHLIEHHLEINAI